MTDQLRAPLLVLSGPFRRRSDGPNVYKYTKTFFRTEFATLANRAQGLVIPVIECA